MPKKAKKPVKTIKKTIKRKVTEEILPKTETEPIKELKTLPLAPMMLVAPKDAFPSVYSPPDAQRVLADFVFEDSRFIIYVKKDDRN